MAKASNYLIMMNRFKVITGGYLFSLTKYHIRVSKELGGNLINILKLSVLFPNVRKS